MIVVIVINVKVACIIRLDDRQIGQNHLDTQNKEKTEIVNIIRLPLSWILTIVQHVNIVDVSHSSCNEIVKFNNLLNFCYYCGHLPQQQ